MSKAQFSSVVHTQLKHPDSLIKRRKQLHVKLKVWEQELWGLGHWPSVWAQAKSSGLHTQPQSSLLPISEITLV